MLLVVDANVLVGELLRVRGRELFGKGILRLRISEQALDDALHEMSRRAARIVVQGGASRPAVNAMLDEARGVVERRISPIPSEFDARFEEGASYRIPRAPDDAPTVALALALGGDEGRCGIWTNDGASSAAGSRRGPPTPCSRTCVTANAPNHKPTAPPYTRSYSRGVLRI